MKQRPVPSHDNLKIPAFTVLLLPHPSSWDELCGEKQPEAQEGLPSWMPAFQKNVSRNTDWSQVQFLQLLICQEELWLWVKDVKKMPCYQARHIERTDNFASLLVNICLPKDTIPLEFHAQSQAASPGVVQGQLRTERAELRPTNPSASGSSGMISTLISKDLTGPSTTEPQEALLRHFPINKERGSQPQHSYLKHLSMSADLPLLT